ncbi:SpaA isopeptide-forming pilin-related protein [Microbacterium flavescens]|uniref:SpaA isopeptide-forming pilin-related protein n=1 Tax=Microbacterium flavescens TaxID=69366 RepID=UPI001BDEA727|nr:SpaA isopeptide-forming pilin-related protein [Microbacterium flavescens]
MRRSIREVRSQERRIALRQRWHAGALATVVAGALVFSGMAPAVADEGVTPEAPAEQVVATAPENPAEPAAPAEEPAAPAEEPAEAPAEEPAAPAEEPAAPGEGKPAPEEATGPVADAPPAADRSISALAAPQAEIAPMALLACAGWPVAGSPVAGFEIDGNLCLDGAGTKDWATVGGQPVTDDGFDDATQFTGGASESNWPWTANQVSGAGVATGQSDIGNVYAYTQTVNGNVYAYLGFERDATTGTIGYYVELNQKPNSSGPVPDRTVGDLRLTIEQNGNITILLVGAHTWNGTKWVSLGSLAGFVGQTAQGNIDNLSGDVLKLGSFAEAAINLTTLFGDSGCSGAYGVLNVRSNSSAGNENSSMKDWIAPVALDVPSTCSTLTIVKTDALDPSKVLPGAEFTISPNPATGTGSTSGTTNAQGQIVFSGNVEPGQYTITETKAPVGYLLDTTPKQVTVGAAESKTVTFADPLGSASWVKHDGAGALLGGATFRVTATNGAAAAAPWNLHTAPITVVDNGARDTDPTAGEITVAGLPTGTYSVVETAAPAGYVLDPSPQSFTVSQQTPNVTLATAYVNIPYATVTLTKAWVNSFPGDKAQLAFSGDASKQGTSTAPTNGPAVQVSVEPGAELDLAETLADANTGLYTSTLSCVGATVSKNTGTGGSITVPEWPASANGVQCTFTNTAVTKTVTLQKHWIDAVQGDKAELTAGTETATSTATGAAEQLDTTHTAVATVRVGDTITLSEALAGKGVYGSSYSCTTGAAGDALSFQLKVPDDDVTCTFENEAQRATVTLKKKWVAAFAGDTADLDVTGAETDSATSTATEGDSTDAVNTASVNVRVGEKVALAEDLGGGNTGSYTTTWSCDDGTAGAGGSIPEFTVKKSVTCTITNTAKTTDIVVNKLWLDAFDGDAADLSINGKTETSTANGDAMQIDNDVVTRTVRIGEKVTVSEALDAENTGVYLSTYSCLGAGGQGGGRTTTFTAPGVDVECTFTNIAKKVDVTLQKRWIDAIQGDTAGLTAGTETAKSTASGASEQLDTADTAVTAVRVGDTVSLSEVVKGQGAYGSTYSCNAGDTTGDGNGRAFDLTVPNADVTCTFENEAERATVTLKKSWVKAFLGDTAGLEITGSESDSATSTAPEGTGVDNTNTASVSVRVGDEVALSEELGDNTGTYTSTWSCDDGASGSGRSIPEFTVTESVVCTITNTAKTTDIVVDKVWVDAFSGDEADLSVNGTTGTSTATGAASETDESVVALTVRVGDQVTVSEVLGGENRGEYESTYECSPAGGEGTGTSTTFTAPDADVECTFTNTAITVGVLLQKRWLGGVALDQSRLSIVREGGAEIVNTSIAAGGLLDQLDNVRTVLTQARIGEILSMAETVTGLGQYESKYLCSTGLTSGNGDGRLFQLTVTQPSICVFANRALTQSVSVVKTWVNGQAGDTAELSISGAATGSETSTADGTMGEFTDVTNMVTADALIGRQVTVSELIGVEAGDPSDYASSLVCIGADDTVLLDVDDVSGSFTMPNQPVDCEFVNEAELPTIALDKTVVVERAEVSETDWQLSATPEEGDAVTDADGGDVAPTEVPTGVGFELSEDLIGDFAGSDEFEPGEWSCVSDISGEIDLSDSVAGSAALRSLDKGENVVCSIVNSHVDQGYVFDKSLVSSNQNEDGTWTVTYDITVHNNSELVTVEYDLTDAIDATDGVVMAASWTGATEGEFAEGSLEAQLANDRPLAPFDGSNDDVYTVTVIAAIASVPDGVDPCAGEDGGIGIVNTAVLTVGGDAPVEDEACGTIHLDDVGLEKSSSATSVEPGVPFDYVLTVTNHGTRDAAAVHVRDADLHSRLDIVGLTLSDGFGMTIEPGWTENSDTQPNDIVDLTLGTPLAPGASMTVTISVVLAAQPAVSSMDPADPVPTPPAPLASLVNNACVDTMIDTVGGPFDGEPFAPNCDDLTIEVREMTGVVYTACVSDTAVLRYILRTSPSLSTLPVSGSWVTKDEPNAAGHSLTIGEFFAGPDGVTGELQWPGSQFVGNPPVAVDYPGWRALQASDYGSDGGYLNPADGIEYAPEDARFFVYNGLILDPSELDFAWRGESTVTFEVNPTIAFDVEYPTATGACFQARHSQVEIVKTASVENTKPGGALTYDLEVANFSVDSAADGVIVTDEIPADLKITDVTWSGEGDTSVFPNWESCEVTGQDSGGYGGTLECVLFGPLQPQGSEEGASAAPTITLAATVDPQSQATSITNVAVVDYHTFGDEGDPGRDSDDATVTVSQLAALSATGGGAVWPLAIFGLLTLLAGATTLVVRRRRGEVKPMQ